MKAVVCIVTNHRKGVKTATDLPFSDTDPLISKVMGEGPFHFVITVSNAVLPLALAFVKEVDSPSALFNEHLKKRCWLAKGKIWPN